MKTVIEVMEELEQLLDMIQFAEDEEGQIGLTEDIQVQIDRYVCELLTKGEGYVAFATGAKAKIEGLMARAKTYAEQAKKYSTQAKSIEETLKFINYRILPTMIQTIGKADKDGKMYLENAGRKIRVALTPMHCEVKEGADLSCLNELDPIFVAHVEIVPNKKAIIDTRKALLDLKEEGEISEKQQAVLDKINSLFDFSVKQYGRLY